MLKRSRCFLPINFKGRLPPKAEGRRGGARVTWTTLLQGSLLRWAPCSAMSDVNHKRLRPRQGDCPPRGLTPSPQRKEEQASSHYRLCYLTVSPLLSLGLCLVLCKFAERGVEVVGARVGWGGVLLDLPAGPQAPAAGSARLGLPAAGAAVRRSAPSTWLLF